MRFRNLYFLSLFIALNATPLLAKAPVSASSATAPALAQADEKNKEGDYEGAEAIYKKILAKNPENTAALRGLAQVSYWQGNYQTSIEQYDKILAKNPNDIDALVGNGKAYLAMGKQRKAQEYFSRAEKIDPKNEEAKAIKPEMAKTTIALNAGFIFGDLNYAPNTEGEFQELVIQKEKDFGLGLNTQYLRKFDQNSFQTTLFGHYFVAENTRLDAGVSFAPRTAVVPEASTTVGISQTFGKLTPELHYTFQDYRQATINAITPALYVHPFEFLKIGGGYQLQVIQFLGTTHKMNNGFGEVFFTPLEWMTVTGFYWRTNNVFEAGRTPSPYLNFKSNIGGGGIDLQFPRAYSIHFDSRYESRNNGETASITTVALGYLF